MNRPRPLVRLGLALAALAVLGSCTTVTKYFVEEAAEAVNGSDADVTDGGPQGSSTGQTLKGHNAAGTPATVAVHEVGPTPGWERGFRAHAFFGPGHYQNRVCVNIPLNVGLGRLWSQRLPDPFDSSEHLDAPLLVQENNQGIPPEYTQFGEVRLAGPSPTATTFRPEGVLGSFGSTGVDCSFLGIVSFGRPSALALILR